MRPSIGLLAHFNGGLPFREASGKNTRKAWIAFQKLQWGPPISGGIGPTPSDLE